MWAQYSCFGDELGCKFNPSIFHSDLSKWVRGRLGLPQFNEVAKFKQQLPNSSLSEQFGVTSSTMSKQQIPIHPSIDHKLRILTTLIIRAISACYGRTAICWCCPRFPQRAFSESALLFPIPFSNDLKTGGRRLTTHGIGKARRQMNARGLICESKGACNVFVFPEQLSFWCSTIKEFRLSYFQQQQFLVSFPSLTLSAFMIGQKHLLNQNRQDPHCKQLRQLELAIPKHIAIFRGLEKMLCHM